MWKILAEICKILQDLPTLSILIKLFGIIELKTVFITDIKLSHGKPYMHRCKIIWVLSFLTSSCLTCISGSPQKMMTLWDGSQNLYLQMESISIVISNHIIYSSWNFGPESIGPAIWIQTTGFFPEYRNELWHQVN